MSYGVELSEIQFVRSLISALKAVEVPVKVPLYRELSTSVKMTGNKETQFVPFVNPIGSPEDCPPYGELSFHFVVVLIPGPAPPSSVRIPARKVGTAGFTFGP